MPEMEISLFFAKEISTPVCCILGYVSDWRQEGAFFLPGFQLLFIHKVYLPFLHMLPPSCPVHHLVVISFLRNTGLFPVLPGSFPTTRCMKTACLYWKYHTALQPPPFKHGCIQCHVIWNDPFAAEKMQDLLPV